MSGIADNKDRGRLRTATANRAHPSLPQKRTAHLELYLLGKERERLERELLRLRHRQERIRGHLAEIDRETGILEQAAERTYGPLPSTMAGTVSHPRHLATGT